MIFERGNFVPNGQVLLSVAAIEAQMFIKQQKIN